MIFKVAKLNIQKLFKVQNYRNVKLLGKKPRFKWLECVKTDWLFVVGLSLFLISFQYTKNIFNTFPLTDQLIPPIVEKVPINGGMNLKAVTKNGLPNS